ncbi:major facilitator superfamily domain-containing protein [Mycena crocata]|nr:major facilitator superfamily domain-containing protein [Mycena crocata]
MPGRLKPLPLAESRDNHTGTSRILGPRWAQLPSLTIGSLGVQVLWSVQMSYASPYLLSLGLTKSNVAIVLLAGPLSGFLMQPLIGVVTDNSTSRWGRRRPYMLGGCILCVASMLLLGYTRQLSAVFTGNDNPTNDVLTIWLAILSIILMDFCINSVQAVDRALLVDTLPVTRQASGNAWAARMLGIGSIIGFFVGNLDLPSFLPIFGSSELQGLSVIVSVLLLFGHLITAVMVKESVLDQNIEHTRPSFIAEIKQIFASMATLPRVIRQICMIQFFAWLGWFPIRFYTTMYISDLHARSMHTRWNQEEIAAEGTRLGARALFFSAILALVTNLVLPQFTLSSVGMPLHPGGLGIPARFKLPLSTLWAGSHLLFGACMLGTFFVSSVDGAMLLIALTGIPWAVTQWAPFSLLAEAILTGGKISYPLGKSPVVEEEHPLLEAEPRTSTALAPRPSLNHTNEHFMTNDSSEIEQHEMNSPLFEKLGADSDAQSNLGRRAGVILGIHNVFIVVPQFLVIILCAVVFAVLDPAVSQHGPVLTGSSNSIVYIFRLGTLWSLFAFAICRQLASELRD